MIILMKHLLLTITNLKVGDLNGSKRESLLLMKCPNLGVHEDHICCVANLKKILT